jgi:hypothetical protein
VAFAGAGKSPRSGFLWGSDAPARRKRAAENLISAQRFLKLRDVGVE